MSKSTLVNIANKDSALPKVGIFYNLTQHELTEDQRREIKSKGWVIDTLINRDRIKELITFNDIPTGAEIEARAYELVKLIRIAGRLHHQQRRDANRFINVAMIGGAPFFMSRLEHVLLEVNITPLYAFSKREVIETTNEDGTVTKQAVFRHLGFINPDLR